MTPAQNKSAVTIDSLTKALRIAQIADAAKAEEIVILDVRGLSTVTDFFVIFTGTSQTHLRAIGKRVDEGLSKLGVEAERVDGRESTNWIVFDYGSVIAHAMMEDARRFYDLERLWGDAPQVDWKTSES
jgi:ribosome-associated protein